MTRALGTAVVALGCIVGGRQQAVAQTKPLECKAWGDRPALGTVCILARDDTVFGHRMPAGTKLHYDTTGVMDFVVFMKPTLFDGLELSGSGEGPFHAFYANGTPRRLWLERTQDVQGVPCRPISFWTEIIGHTSAVLFHPDGRLQACRLGRSATIQGVVFAKGERIEFDADGKTVPRGR